MPIRRSSYSVTVGQALRLDVCQGEDRLFCITFTEPAESPNAGNRVDFSGAQSIHMNVRGPVASGTFSASFVGSGLIAAFVPNSWSTGLAEQLASTDVTTVASDGYRTQVLVRSTLEISKGLH